MLSRSHTILHMYLLDRSNKPSIPSDELNELPPHYHRGWTRSEVDIHLLGADGKLRRAKLFESSCYSQVKHAQPPFETSDQKECVSSIKVCAPTCKSCYASWHWYQEEISRGIFHILTTLFCAPAMPSLSITAFIYSL